jgi:transcriptional regulator with XRE-family HTH domain
MENTHEKIAEDLKTLRLEKGISLYRLAKISGLSYPTLWRAEKGKKGISMNTYLTIKQNLEK